MTPPLRGRSDSSWWPSLRLRRKWVWYFLVVLYEKRAFADSSCAPAIFQCEISFSGGPWQVHDVRSGLSADCFTSPSPRWRCFERKIIASLAERFLYLSLSLFCGCPSDYARIRQRLSIYLYRLRTKGSAVRTIGRCASIEVPSSERQV